MTVRRYTVLRFFIFFLLEEQQTFVTFTLPVQVLLARLRTYRERLVGFHVNPRPYGFTSSFSTHGGTTIEKAKQTNNNRIVWVFEKHSCRSRPSGRKISRRADRWLAAAAVGPGAKHAQCAFDRPPPVGLHPPPHGAGMLPSGLVF